MFKKGDIQILAILSIITIIGAIVRFYGLTNIGLRFYDEGYYIRFARGFVRNGKTLRLKPGHVMLIALSFAIFGVVDYAAIIPSAFFGTLTIPLLYLITKRLSNERAGLFTAASFSVCEFSLLYSRSALADANMIFFIALSFYLYISTKNSSRLQDMDLSRNSSRNYLLLFLCGLVGSFSFAVKDNALLFIGLLFVFEIFLLLPKEIVQLARWKPIFFLLFSFIAGFLIIYLPLVVLNQWPYDLLLTRRQSISQAGFTIHPYRFIQLWELVGPLVLVLMGIGIIRTFAENDRYMLLITIWFLVMLLFWSTYAHIQPRDFAQALPPVTILAGMGADGFLRYAFSKTKKIRFSYRSELVLTLVLCATIIISSSFIALDTILLESTAYRDVCEFLREDDTKGGFATLSGLGGVYNFYTGRRWLWNGENTREMFAEYLVRGYTHVVIDYNYYFHSYNLGKEILEKCTPIYKVFNPPSLHKYTLLETYYPHTVDRILNDPDAHYIYVFTLEEVVSKLNLI